MDRERIKIVATTRPQRVVGRSLRLDPMFKILKATQSGIYVSLPKEKLAELIAQPVNLDSDDDFFDSELFKQLEDADKSTAE